MNNKQYPVAMMHPFDPRGSKVGGLETYTRDFIRFHPQDFSVLLIGVDGVGDLKLGEVIPLRTQDRDILFLPIIRYPEANIHEAATSIGKSITFQFALGLLKYLPKIRKLLRSGGYTVDLRRVEFSWICIASGVKFLQMLHGEGAPKMAMDSLLKKHRYVHNLNQNTAMRYCERFLCVNPFITQRIKSEYPKYQDKISTLTTWYNPEVYQPTPFNLDDGKLKIVFCGRLDAFKVPELIFQAIAQVADRLGRGRVQFHYIGTSDPHRFSEYKLVEDLTVLHGFKRPPEMAKILDSVHCGILTSEFEGMPRFVLETLGAGRPTVAVHLPQLEPVIEDGVSGFLIPRDERETMLPLISERIIQLWALIQEGGIAPELVAEHVADYTPAHLLGLVYSYHRQIQDAGPLPDKVGVEA